MELDRVYAIASRRNHSLRIALRRHTIADVHVVEDHVPFVAAMCASHEGFAGGSHRIAEGAGCCDTNELGILGGLAFASEYTALGTVLRMLLCA